MKKIMIVGASGHGKVVADIAKKIGYEEIMFLDDNENLRSCGGYPVIGISDLAMHSSTDTIVAIGNAEIRQCVQEKIVRNQGNIVTLIHPNAVIAEDVKIGLGTVIWQALLSIQEQGLERVVSSILVHRWIMIANWEIMCMFQLAPMLRERSKLVQKHGLEQEQLLVTISLFVMIV